MSKSLFSDFTTFFATGRRVTLDIRLQRRCYLNDSCGFFLDDAHFEFDSGLLADRSPNQMGLIWTELKSGILKFSSQRSRLGLPIFDSAELKTLLGFFDFEPDEYSPTDLEQVMSLVIVMCRAN